MGWATWAAYIATLILNGLSNTGAFFGRTNAQISHMHPTPLTPADWAFSIWGTIFMAQGAAIYLLANRKNEEDNRVRARILKAIAPCWYGGWLFQSLWQVLFCYNSGSSLAACSVMLIGATLCFRAAFDRTHAILTETQAFSRLTRATLTAASAINSAWLSVATCLGILIALRVNTSTDLVPVAVGLGGALVVNGLAVARGHRSVLHAATLVWSFVAVYAAQASKYVAIQRLSIVGAASLAVAAVLTLVRGGGKDVQPELA